MTGADEPGGFEVVAAGAGEPAVSLLMPVRNQRAFVAAAIATVLNQQEVIVELLVADDASDDGTGGEIDRALKDQQGSRHRIRRRRNQRKLGLSQNVALVEAASAPICIAAHGDDLSCPQRARRVLELFARTGADMVSSNVEDLDEDGGRSVRVCAQPEGWISAAAMIQAGWMPPMLGAALAWRKAVYRSFPRLDAEYLAFGHDWVAPFRAAVGRGFYYTPEPLLQYRRHGGQLSVHLYQSPSIAAMRENMLFRHLAVCRAMRRDLDHCSARSGIEAECSRALLAGIETRSAELFDEFLEVREQLYRDGKRALWLDEADFGELQQYRFRLRFFSRGRWRRLRAWWRAHFAR